MSRFFLIGFFLFTQQNIVFAQNEDEIFTIYLVRHAEQQSGDGAPSDPPLAFCGEQRVEALTRVLSDIKLEKIYSSSYKRTLETAVPIADSRKLEVDEYDPRKLEDFSDLLLEKRQSVLVAGHSNTTGVLAGLLAGAPGEAFAEDIFDRLYQVVIAGDQRRINLLHQSFHCER